MGCHSAKFDNEKDLHILRQAVIRYDIKHPVLNDNDFKMWKSMGVNCWPTVMVIGPDCVPILRLTGEQVEKRIEAMLYCALLHFGKTPGLLRESDLPL